MRLEWIEDILAVLDSGSLARAAERRLLTQSAFTRRVRLIEENLGATLFDRSKKPVTLLPDVARLEPDLRRAAADLRRLRDRLRVAAGASGRSYAFACQHALSATLSPALVKVLAEEDGVAARMLSGDRDECLGQLLVGDVDFAVMYDLPDEEGVALPKAFDMVVLGQDLLIPVAVSGLAGSVGQALAMPLISYPHTVFLGQVFDRTIAPRLPAGTLFDPKAETALTLAMLQFALNGLGIAWLPLSLVAEMLTIGRLQRVEGLPEQPLDLKLFRLSDGPMTREDRVWQRLSGLTGTMVPSKALPDGQPGAVEPFQ